MVDVRKVFPNAFESVFESSWGGPDVGYDDLYKQFGTPLVDVDIGSYQGDTLVVLEKEGMYGYLSFGWGSCSGCDALQACEDFDDLQELSDHLESSIKWFDSKEELKAWVNKHDWEGEWFSYSDRGEVSDFINQVNSL